MSSTMQPPTYACPICGNTMSAGNVCQSCGVMLVPVNRYRSDAGVQSRPLVLDLQQARASRLSILSSKDGGTKKSDDSILVLDLGGPVQGTHWVVYQVGVLGVFAVRNIVAPGQPTTGLFLVDQAVDTEKNADATIANVGWNPAARLPMPLPSRIQTQPIGTIFAFQCVYDGLVPFTVPYGSKLRFIANVAPGTATPGPGTNSFANFAAAVCVENDLTALTNPLS